MAAPSYPDNPLDAFKDEFDLDTPDGFRKYVKKTLSSISCTSGKSEESAKGTHPPEELKDFTENRGRGNAFDPDDNVYNFTHAKRGLAVIINNEDFSKSKDFGDRPGSSYDASSLYHSFRNLGFDVMPYDNLSAWKMVEVLKAAALQYSHSDADCFACAILSHGDQILTQKEWDRLGQDVRLDLLFGSDGKAIATKAIIEIFSDKNCPSLVGKPRLFFLQACRGDQYDDGQMVKVTRPKPMISLHQGRGYQRDGKDSKDEIDSNANKSALPTVERQESLSSSVDPPQYLKQDATDAAAVGDDSDSDEEVWKKKDSQPQSSIGATTPSDKTDSMWNPVTNVPVSPAPIYKDCLVMYATPPGHFAWRRRTGAWFIQSLCKVFDTNILTSVSLLRVLTLVCGMTAREYQSENPGNPSMHGKKEVPVIESMLVKDVFIPSRGRTLRLH